MTGLALTVVALVAALFAAGWAGLLALAEEAPGVARPLASGDGDEPMPLHRALQISRVALIILAGVAASEAVGWWMRPPLQAFGTLVVAASFLFMVADAIPRAVGVLAPEAATAGLPLARRTLFPFRPLLALIAALERNVQDLLPQPLPDEGARLAPTQRDILLGVFALGDTTVADIMTPRIDIAAVDTASEWDEVLQLLRDKEHARVPVYESTLDNVVGILHARDLVPAVGGVQDPPERWQDLIRPAEFIPESKTLAAQLRDFRRGPSSHIAIVVDEFGGTSGLLTLVDILEEVVGDIRDEYDVDEPAVEREGADRFWVDGSLGLDELSALLGTTLDQDQVSTVGGLIYAELGRVPNAGDEFRIGDFRVVVEQVVRRRVRRVFFERLQPLPELGIAAEDNQ